MLIRACVEALWAVNRHTVPSGGAIGPEHPGIPES